MSEKQQYLNSIIDVNSPAATKLDRWIKVFKNDNWFNPKAYGDVDIESFNDSLSTLATYAEHDILNIPYIYKALNINENDVFNSINKIINENNTKFKVVHSIELRLYQAWLSLTNNTMNADAFIRFNDATESIRRTSYPSELIIHASSFIQTQNDSDKLKTYILDKLNNDLNINTIRDKYKDAFGVTEKVQKWLDLEKLTDDEYKSRINRYLTTIAAIDFAFPASKHIKVDPYVFKNKDISSLLYLVQKGVMPLRASIEGFFTENPDLFVDNKTIISIKRLLETPDLPTDNSKFSKEYEYLFKKQILNLAYERKQKNQNNGLPNELNILAIHNSLGIDTKLYELEVTETTRDLGKVVEFNPKTEYFNKLSNPIKSAFLYLDFKIDNKMLGLRELDAKDKVDLLKTQDWFSSKVNDAKDKISSDTLALYLAAIDKKDPNWIPIFSKVLKSIQSNTSRSRSYIKLIKDAGGPTNGAVSRDFDDVSAFIYAMLGTDPKPLRLAADTLGVRVTSDEYSAMVEDFARKTLGFQTANELALPELDIVYNT